MVAEPADSFGHSREINRRKWCVPILFGGVLADQIIQIKRKGSSVDHPLRLIQVRGSAHTSRGRRHGRKFSSTGPSSDGIIRIVTDMLDVPAELIAQIYSLRWTIELFFKMFKHLLGCRHLLSTKQNGVEIQVYCAIIACMLIILHTGAVPRNAPSK